MAIREAKVLNKISLDKIYDSLFTYEQEVNEIKIEEKKEAIDKKKPSFEYEFTLRRNKWIILWGWRRWNDHCVQKIQETSSSKRSMNGKKKLQL